MKKRNKKYNPNKVAQQHAARKAKSEAEWKKLDVLYEFDMDFVVEHANNTISEYAEKHNLADDEWVPAHVVVDAYGQQDLIIALKKSLISTPERWEVGVDSHFYNLETDEIQTIPFSLTLPAMTHEELMNGCARKVNFIDVIKTVREDTWKGLQEEMIANWEKEGIKPGFKLTQSQVRIVAQAHFKNHLAYCRFQTYLDMRDSGGLLQALAAEESLKMTINTQELAA